MTDMHHKSPSADFEFDWRAYPWKPWARNIAQFVLRIKLSNGSLTKY
ncbi:hypothetical protein HDE79_004388 [Rhodanobacter sp. MP1X3]|nr:hypothetical protein [Rhodanobacter sp. MP1X3]